LFDDGIGFGRMKDLGCCWSRRGSGCAWDNVNDQVQLALARSLAVDLVKEADPLLMALSQ